MLRPEVDVRVLGPSGRSRIRRYLGLLPWLAREQSWVLGHDIVHAHLTFGSAVASAVQLLCKLHRSRQPKIVETYHAVGTPVPLVQRAIAARLAQGRDAFVLVAKDPYWEDFRRRAHPVVMLIPNGIPLPERPGDHHDAAVLRTALGVPAGCSYVVGTVGRLVKERLPLRLVAAIAEADRLLEGEAHYILGGEGPMLADIRAECERLGIADRVHLPGIVRHPPEVFSGLDLYLTLNVGAITGIAALEAAGFGLPVVAIQAIDGRRAELDDWIWSSSDPREVGAEIAARVRDRAGTAALARRQQQHVFAHHRADQMASAYERLYSDLLGGSVGQAGRRRPA